MSPGARTSKGGCSYYLPIADSMKIEGEGRHPVPAKYLVTLQEFAADKGIAPQDVLRDRRPPAYENAL